tara:strand:- start:99 stop:782 length:684 start_codon:yes stop_codon:yes gene_type:complete
MKKKYTIEKIDVFFYNYSYLKKVLSDQEINTLFLEWESNNNVNPHDYFWSLFNKALIVNAEKFRDGGSESNFYQTQESLYYIMAYFRRDEGANKETINQFIRLAFQSIADGAKYAISGDIETEINVISNTKTNFAPEYLCQYGSSENQKKYAPEEFMDKCFIATDKCTNENGCSCSIAPTVKRDSDGNIIRKKEINISSKSNKESKGCVMVFIPIIILITIASIFTF